MHCQRGSRLYSYSDWRKRDSIPHNIVNNVSLCEFQPVFGQGLCYSHRGFRNDNRSNYGCDRERIHMPGKSLSISISLLTFSPTPGFNSAGGSSVVLDTVDYPSWAVCG